MAAKQRHSTKASISLQRARATIEGCERVGDLHRQGHAWVQRRWLPALRRLSDARARGDRRLAAGGYQLLGDVHDLNGAPRAAIRAYQRSLKADSSRALSWRAIGSMLDNLGEFQRARHAFLRAARLAPDDELLATDIERVEWALHQGCPVLFEPGSLALEVSEALAAGRHGRASELLARKRSLAARRLRARLHGVRGEAEGVERQWTAIAAARRKVQFQPADWYYAFQGAAGDDPRLWRLMLWKVRRKLDGGSFSYPASLWDLDATPAKRFELFARFELARCEGDVEALLGLAASHPSWREPGELVLRLRAGRRGDNVRTLRA